MPRALRRVVKEQYTTARLQQRRRPLLYPTRIKKERISLSEDSWLEMAYEDRTDPDVIGAGEPMAPWCDACGTEHVGECIFDDALELQEALVNFWSLLEADKINWRRPFNELHEDCDPNMYAWTAAEMVELIDDDMPQDEVLSVLNQLTALHDKQYKTGQVIL